MSYKVSLIKLNPDWPCDGPLLKLAVDVANRLLPGLYDAGQQIVILCIILISYLAFETATGLPYGTVNLRYGVPPDETTVTCTASCGTFLLEFGLLSRLTGC